MAKFTEQKVRTVGELRKLLERFPDDKLLIVDDGCGNTWTPVVYNWADEADDDLDWPLAIK